MAELLIDTRHTTPSIPQNDHADGLQPTHKVQVVADIGSQNPGTDVMAVELRHFMREVRGEIAKFQAKLQGFGGDIANIHANLQGFRQEFQQFVQSLTPQSEKQTDIEDSPYVVDVPLHEKSVECQFSSQWEKGDEGDAMQQLLVDEHVESTSVEAQLPPMIMDDDDVGQSLFVVVSHEHRRETHEALPYFSSILKLETPRINNIPEYAAAPNFATEHIKKIQVNEKEFVARFSQPRVVYQSPHSTLSSPISWLFSPPTSSTEDLYIVPDCSLDSYYIHVGAPLHGFKLNFGNGEMCQPIMPPAASKFDGHVVNRGGLIYFMARPDSYYETPDPVFECYDPVENKWKALEPFPDHAFHQLRRFIVATAVWDDTILYNMSGCEIWAYNIRRDKWFIVNVENGQCYSIVGEAIVLENTIYALTKQTLDLVVAVSIEREEIDGDDVYKCSLLSEISVSGMDQSKFEVEVPLQQTTRHLVHLGKDNFCIVQNCRLQGFNRYQPIQLISIKRTGERSMIVTGVCVYEVELLSGEQFEAQIQRAEKLQEKYERTQGIYKEITDILLYDLYVETQQLNVRLCFSLPDCKTTALKEGERFLFDLDPFPEDYASKNLEKTEGNCFCVRNLPPDATFTQLEDGLHNEFKDIQNAWIQVVINNTGNPFAIVDFQSEPSKQRAIKGSSIMIGDGLTIVDCHRSGAEVSPSKAICEGHNVQGDDGSYHLRSCSNSSIMDDDTGPRSLFVVVSWDDMVPGSISILQLDTLNNNLESAEIKIQDTGFPVNPQSSFSSLETLMNQKEYVAHFSRPQGSAMLQWVSTSCNSSEELYMLPFSCCKVHFPMHGCIFNLRTKTTRQSKPPKATNKFGGHVLNLSGYIYFMEKSSYSSYSLDSSFERYDPANDSWQMLEPFPLDAANEHGSCGNIQATAVWNDTILFMMDGRASWAYDVERDKWYHVIADDFRCYSIEGEAVVVENTIYALTTVSFDFIVALSIEREEIGDDCVYKCSLRSRIRVPKMKHPKFLRTRHLVHLSKDKFCLVQSCLDVEGGCYDYDPIHITNIKLEEENTMTVTGECVHMLENEFKVLHCFSLPECKTTARREGERFLFDLNPYSAGLEKGHFSSERIRSHVYAMSSFAPEVSSLGDDDAVSEMRNTIEEQGHYVYLRNVPSDATFRQVEKELKKFGLVKGNGIQVIIDDEGYWYSIVEFENATSKQCAIKASAIFIKGCRVEIEDYTQDEFTEP